MSENGNESKIKIGTQRHPKKEKNTKKTNQEPILLDFNNFFFIILAKIIHKTSPLHMQLRPLLPY